MKAIVFVLLGCCICQLTSCSSKESEEYGVYIRVENNTSLLLDKTVIEANEFSNIPAHYTTKYESYISEAPPGLFYFKSGEIEASMVWDYIANATLLPGHYTFKVDYENDNFGISQLTD